MDDSGVLTAKENTFVYGGLFFYSSQEYNEFIIRYKSLINKIKCCYCHNSLCNKKCPEIKGSLKLSSATRRRIFNLLKKQKCYGVLVNNQKIFKSILNNKLARGRFCEYAQKRIVKEIVYHAIKEKMINEQESLKMEIKIDESNFKSNGYYNLFDSIYEELVHGNINYNYFVTHKALLKNGLELKVKKYNSKNNYGIQSADMIANLIHRKFKQNNLNDLEFITVKLFLP